MADGPPFNTCERHPDCLFLGGCDCKRQALRERRIEPPFISEHVCPPYYVHDCPLHGGANGTTFPDGTWIPVVPDDE